MSKRKSRKIDLSNLFDISPNQTLIRPINIAINLENRGKDYKLEYKETFKEKQPKETQKWTIETTLKALNRIQEELSAYHRYFIYQIKAIKKGYEIMLISDDSYALLTAILGELLAFGIREKEDAQGVTSLMESLLKWISKANIIDEIEK
ncbi:MAG TPA: hypothetical protein VMV49_11050 [Candidatus Deferrimicrobium sp.]|nr:hypothetical protein [Candidatus Deferrimicrobium sp.]